MEKTALWLIKDMSSADRLLMLLALLSGVISNLLFMTTPVYVIMLYDKIIPHYSNHALVLSTIGALTLLLLASFLDLIRARFLSRVGANFQRKYENTLARVSKSKDAYTRSISELNSTRELDNIRSFINSKAFKNITEIILLPCFIAIVFYYNHSLSLLILVGICLLFIISKSRHIRTQPVLRKNSNAAKSFYNYVEKIKLSESAIRSQGVEHIFVGSLEKKRNENRESSILDGDFLAIHNGIVSHARNSIYIIGIACGAYHASNQYITTGMLVSYIIILNKSLQTTDNLGSSLPAFSDFIKNIRTVLAELSVEVPVGNSPNFSTDNAIEVSELPVRTDSGINKRINISIRHPSVVEVVGPPSSGKSFIAESLIKLNKPSSGFIRIFGVNIEDITPEAFSSTVSYIPDFPTFFQGSIFENIAPEASSVDRKEIKEFLEKNLLIGGHLSKIDDAKNISHVGHPLSKQEKDSLSIARAIYKRPSIIISDLSVDALEVLLAYSVDRLVEGGVTLVCFSRQPSTLSSLRGYPLFHI